MDDVLKELYEERFQTHWRTTPEYRALARKEDELWERVKPLLGQEMIDQLMDSQSNVSHRTNYEWFREGFRLGAGLMLELL